MRPKIKQVLQQSIAVKQAILADPNLLQNIEVVTAALIAAFRADRKVWLCGNGGSASDAQHIAAEFSGRFYFDRPPLFAEALTVNTSYLTAVANDYGFEYVYQRLVEAKGRRGDVLIGLSTSGNSPNVVNALQVAQNQGLITVAMTGETGGKLAGVADYLINVPSSDTPRIQESHITIGHIFCELVEAALFEKS